MEKEDIVRFKWWTIGCVSSLVASFSYTDEIDNILRMKDIPFRDVWIFYSGIATAIISIAGLLLCVFASRERRVCRVDSILVWLNAILWISEIMVAIIGDGTKRIITSQLKFIFEHPNAYFFSILGSAVSVLILASWFKECISQGNEWSAFTSWFLLAAMAIFTTLSLVSFRDRIEFGELDQSNQYNITRNDLVASVSGLVSDYVMTGESTIENVLMENSTITNITKAYLENRNQTDFHVNDPIQDLFYALAEAGVLKLLTSCEVTIYSCSRMKYATGLSAATAIIAFVMAPLKGFSPTCQIDFAITLYLIWLPSLAILTASPGPATLVGNIFFGIYICYFLVLDIFITSVTSTVSTEKIENKTVVDLGGNDVESRDDVWQAAYGKLEIKPSKDEDRNRSNSYEALFDEAECWDDEKVERLTNPIDGFRWSTRLSSASSLKKRKYASAFNVIVANIDQDAPKPSPDRTGFAILGNWEQRIRRLRLWFVLLSTAIVLVNTIPQYEYPLGLYIVPIISLSLSCVGIITCLRTTKLSDIIQIMSLAGQFANWMYGSYIAVWLYKWHTFSFSSPVVIVHLLLGERDQNIDSDPNVFFGVWISAVTTILLVMNGCKASMLTSDWLLFAVASAVLFFSSLKNIAKEEDVESNNGSIIPCDTKCTDPSEKLIFAKYLGLASLGVCLLMTVLYRFGPTFHVIASIPLLISWSYGVFYVAFWNAESIPATIYFAFWGGLLLSLELASINFIHFKRRRRDQEASLHENENDEDINISVELKQVPLPMEKSSSNVPDPSSKAFDDASNVPATSNYDDTKGFIDTLTENHDDSTGANKVPSELFDDENLNQDETSPGIKQQTYLKSNIKDGHGRDKESVESSVMIDSNSNMNNGLQDWDNVDEETNMITDASRSRMESTLLDNTNRQRAISVDSDDFMDCQQIEISENFAPEFLSARSSVPSPTEELHS